MQTILLDERGHLGKESQVMITIFGGLQVTYVTGYLIAIALSVVAVAITELVIRGYENFIHRKQHRGNPADKGNKPRKIFKRRLHGNH